MELLDLPPELFQRIIYLLVEDVGPVDSFAASFTCQIFSAAIHENIFTLQPLGNLLHKRGHPATHLFWRHGGQMLYNRLSRTASDHVSQFICMTVDALVEKCGSTQDDVRERFTRSLCHAISAHSGPEQLFRDMANPHKNVEWARHDIIKALPAAAAASGEFEILHNLVTCDRDLVTEDKSMILPSAFNAAAAVGNLHVIDWITALLTAPDGGYEASNPYHIYNNDLKRISWDARRCNGCSLESAFMKAIYMFQQQAGVMLLDRVCLLVDSDSDSGGICGCGCGWACNCLDDTAHYLIESCIDVGNFEMLTTLLQHRNKLDGETCPSMDFCGMALAESEWEYLFLSGSRHLIGKMLDAGQMRPNLMGECLPLNEALQYDRYDLVRLLLAHGADVNACDDDGNSVLHLAVERGFAPDVQILLDKGADPTSAKAPRSKKARPCYNLCKAAILVYEVAGVAPGSRSGAAELCELWNVLKEWALLGSTWSRYEELVAQVG